MQSGTGRPAPSQRVLWTGDNSIPGLWIQEAVQGVARHLWQFVLVVQAVTVLTEKCFRLSANSKARRQHCFIYKPEEMVIYNPASSLQRPEQVLRRLYWLPWFCTWRTRVEKKYLLWRSCSQVWRYLYTWRFRIPHAALAFDTIQRQWLQFSYVEKKNQQMSQSAEGGHRELLWPFEAMLQKVVFCRCKDNYAVLSHCYGSMCASQHAQFWERFHCRACRPACSRRPWKWRRTKRKWHIHITVWKPKATLCPASMLSKSAHGNHVKRNCCTHLFASAAHTRRSRRVIFFFMLLLLRSYGLLQHIYQAANWCVPVVATTSPRLRRFSAAGRWCLLSWCILISTVVSRPIFWQHAFSIPVTSINKVSLVSINVALIITCYNCAKWVVEKFAAGYLHLTPALQAEAARKLQVFLDLNMFSMQKQFNCKWRNRQGRSNLDDLVL